MTALKMEQLFTHLAPVHPNLHRKNVKCHTAVMYWVTEGCREEERTLLSVLYSHSLPLSSSLAALPSPAARFERGLLRCARGTTCLERNPHPFRLRCGRVTECLGLRLGTRNDVKKPGQGLAELSGEEQLKGEGGGVN